MAEEKQKNGKVSWGIFIWAIGIIIVAIGWCFLVTDSLSKKVEASNNSLNEIKISTARIETNVAWIMDALKENPTIIKK